MNERPSAEFIFTPPAGGNVSPIGQFTQVPNEWIRDLRISGNALRIIVLIASSYPNALTRDEIRHTLGFGKEALRAGIALLLEAGYLNRSASTNRYGRFIAPTFYAGNPVDEQGGER